MNLLFSKAILNWLNNVVRIEVKASTYSDYKYRTEKYILPYFKDRILEEVVYEDVRSFVSELRNVKTGKALSPNTMHGIVNILVKFFEYCVTNEIVITNPCNLVVLPKRKSKRKITVFTEEERREIIRALEEEARSKSFLILVALHTGMRIGELCSLKWQCVDMKSRQIRVKTTNRRIMKNSKTEVLTTSPKTEDSIREIPITPCVMDYLLQLSKLNSEYVFPKSNGNRYDVRGIQKYFGLLTRRHGIQEKNFHTLRHTFATTAIESKMDVKILSRILGHSNVNTTLNLYVHPNESKIREAMYNLSAYIVR